MTQEDDVRNKGIMADILHYARPKYIIVIIVSLLIAVAMVVTDNAFDSSRPSEADFSGDWTTESGEVVDTDEVTMGRYGGRGILTKDLPDELDYGTALCFTGNNINFTVFIDDEPVYSFSEEENFTGKGYGSAYHTIALYPEWGGRTVKIDAVSVFSSKTGGRIRDISLEPAQSFRSRQAEGMLMPFVFSVGIFSLGLILLLVRIILPFRPEQPDLISLGITAVLAGIWFCCDTGFYRLTMNAVILSRIMDLTLLHIWMLPLFLFIYSVTDEKRKQYVYLAVSLTAADIALVLFRRFVLGIEMSNVLWILPVYYGCMALIIVLMLRSDRRNSRRKRRKLDRSFLVLGLILAGTCLIIDMLTYRSGAYSGTGRGEFTRVGMCAFFTLMAVGSLRAWIREKVSNRREHFINQMLQYALSSGDPEESIASVMEYFGNEFKAGHVFIYENMHDGTFRNTYEWFGAGISGLEDDSYKVIPYEGVIDQLYEVFMQEHRLILDDSEATRQLNPLLHDLIVKLKLKRTVVGPLESVSELKGFFGASIVPKENSREVAGMIWLMSYFITQMLLQRDEKRDLIRYSYHDALTGVCNRRAMDVFEEEHADDAPYGFVMCDINGLKRANDTQGHDAGDEMILDVASCLTEAFGEENVYRLGGDEFAAYSLGTTQEEFEGLVRKVRYLVAVKHRSISIGAAYAADNTEDRKMVKEKADELMYNEKERYYKGRHDRRR